jgi:DnaD/phage-associated family protein
MSYGWIKLWIDILDDDKMFDMPDWLFKRFIYFLLAAKEYDQDGLLQPVNKLAWRLRLSEDQVTESLRALMKVGVVCEDAGSYLIKNFSKRQAISPSALRVKKFREKHKIDFDVTICNTDCNALQDSSSVSSSSSDSLSLIFKYYESEIGIITKVISDEIMSLLDEGVNQQWFLDAIRISAEQNKRSWAYVKAILKRWVAQGSQEDTRKGKDKPKTPKRTDKEIVDDHNKWCDENGCPEQKVEYKISK